ncbi:hypothetical protein CLF_110839 [Clonorchis sinensis]|uniref:Uncharacterized protein n=1 Tax=Clonorchis sinensis TaxID=79923 RepID=G7YTY3_CLOSI|nr:hypothetical protein CLF_110839 [Clonorchis sinensis]
MTIDTMTSVFNTDASLPYNYDLFESVIVKKIIKVVSGVRSHRATEIIFEHYGFLGLFHFLDFLCPPDFTVGSHVHFHLTSDDSLCQFYPGVGDVRGQAAVRNRTPRRFDDVQRAGCVPNESMHCTIYHEFGYRRSMPVPIYSRIRGVQWLRMPLYLRGETEHPLFSCMGDSPEDNTRLATAKDMDIWLVSGNPLLAPYSKPGPTGVCHSQNDKHRFPVFARANFQIFCGARRLTKEELSTYRFLPKYGTPKCAVPWFVAVEFDEAPKTRNIYNYRRKS